MPFHTIGDSHAKHGFELIQINNSPVRIHQLSHSFMYDVGREGLSALDVSRFPIHNGDIVLFSFGEKDCRCLIHQFRENWKQAIDEMVERYFSLIRTNVSKFSDLNVLVYNVLPPAKSEWILDDPEYKSTGSNEERRSYVRYMNQRLAESCEKFSFYFINIYKSYSDSDGFLERALSDGNVHIGKTDQLGLALKAALEDLKNHKTIAYYTRFAAIQKEKQEAIREVLQSLRPIVCKQLEKIRLGNAFDGGYVVPKRCLQCDVVISIGVGPDVSFDLAFAENGKSVFQFDHTVDSVPSHQAHSGFVFFKKGWGARTAGDLLTLKDMLAAANVPTSAKCLLKFDVEGAEYENLISLDDSELASFEVIVCELHCCDQLRDEAFRHQFSRAIARLTKNHAPVHLHGNNYGVLCLVEGVPVPAVLELALLRRDLGDFGGISLEPIPGPLDNPNRPDRPDLCLNPI